MSAHSSVKQNTEIVTESSRSLPMSGRNGSASDADCRISEDCNVPDVELMELGPLLEEGGRQTGPKGVRSEVGVFEQMPKQDCSFSVASSAFCDLFKGSRNAC